VAGRTFDESIVRISAFACGCATLACDAGRQPAAIAAIEMRMRVRFTVRSSLCRQQANEES